MENENNDLEKEAEIEEEEEKETGKKRLINLEIVFFLILGFLLGVVIKTEAAKRVTIGFDDYQIKSLQQSYNFTELEKKISEKSEQATQATDAEQGAQAEGEGTENQ